MMTALNAALIGQDETLIPQITQALERLAKGEETEADRNLFSLTKIVSIGVTSEMLVATTN